MRMHQDDSMLVNGLWFRSLLNGVILYMILFIYLFCWFMVDMFVSKFPIFVRCLGFLSKVIQHDSLSAIVCRMKFVGLLERPPCCQLT